MNSEEPTGPQSCCRGRAKSAMLWALVMLNVALLVALIGRHTPENQAKAIGGVNPADLLAVPGNLPGYSNGVVYLIDNSSGLMTAISYDGASNRVTWLPQPIDIGRVAAAAGGVRGR